ncbi:MAG TPA: SpoIIE family protein phosphatase [Candidatus Baltobacteraceae bacterium]
MTNPAVAASSNIDEFARQIVAGMPDCVKILDLDGRLRTMNEAGRRLFGIDDLSTIQGAQWTDFWTDSDRDAARDAVAEARNGRTGRFIGFLKTFHGEPKWWDVLVAPLTNQDGAVERLLAVSRDVTEHRRSELYFELLSDVGALLNRPLNVEVALDRVARRLTDSVADFCLFEVSDDDDLLVRTAASSRSFQNGDFLHRLTAFTPERGKHPLLGSMEVLTPVCISNADESWVRGVARDSEHAAFINELGITSIISVPIALRGRILGALTVGIVEHGRPYRFDARDVVLFDELARRVAVALDIAQRFQREYLVATTLQHASLPRDLPTIAGMRFDAVYSPAGSESNIGGDWYDAFALRDGRVVISVGDVMGHGLDAAVTMGRVRQAIRCAAVISADPRRILQAADATIKIDPDERIATAVVAVFDPSARTLTCALAGHPSPIRRSAGGRVDEPFAQHGLPLGLRDDLEPHSETVAVAEGDFFTFFTDGLVEFDRDICEGERLLHEAIAKLSIRGPSPAKVLHDEILTKHAIDDVAILTIAFD